TKDLIERTALIRDAIGWDVDMGIEIHRNMTPGEAVMLSKELVPFRPYFVEDPIPPDSILSFGEIASQMDLPMAAGERDPNIWEFREYVEHGNIHYIRPDVGVAGGITHVKKICALAEAHHQGIIPHTVPNGPIAVAAAVHVGVSVPNWEAQEHRPQERPPFSDAVKKVIELKDRWLIPPDAPGLGVEFDEAGAAKHPGPPPIGETPLRFDGSVAIK
ncbi:MAG: enolase C-terminal domain-like protein, partial [Pirellulaceae bacterium]|nr:enolase C-terminal domain-like protein [Pirellulaceae bacterium]